MQAVSWVQNNDSGVPNLELGQLDRWSIIKKYASHTTEAQNLLTEELTRDNSEAAYLAKLFCEAAFPVAESK